MTSQKVFQCPLCYHLATMEAITVGESRHPLFYVCSCCEQHVDELPPPPLPEPADSRPKRRKPWRKQ